MAISYEQEQEIGWRAYQRENKIGPYAPEHIALVNRIVAAEDALETHRTDAMEADTILARAIRDLPVRINNATTLGWVSFAIALWALLRTF